MLFSILFTINIRIATYFVYYKYINHNEENVSVYDYVYQEKVNNNIKMGLAKQIDIKNRTYYLYNDSINIKKSDSNLLKINKESYKDNGIYNIGYITIKKIDDYENIYSLNPLYLIFGHASGYIEEKKMSKYFIFDSADENKELRKKCNDVFNGIRKKIKK